MLSLGLACGLGTFYEMRHGTEAAQRDVYRTFWFALILVTLGTNIFCAMMRRWPFKAHHAGFVLAHIGILTLLTGSLVSLHYGLDSNMALYEGETSDRISLLDRSLHVQLGERVSVVPIAFEKSPPQPGSERRFALPGSDLTLVAEDFLPHAELEESFSEGSAPNPALHFLLRAPFAEQEGWLLAQEPARAHIDFGPASLGFHTAATPQEASGLLRHVEGRNHVSFVRTPDGVLRYALASRGGPGPEGVVELGRPIETPWMGMTLTVDRLLERALASRQVRGAPPPDKDERRQPAVKLRLESPRGRSASEWLLWSEAREWLAGGVPTRVAYRQSESRVPFQVTLLRFRSEKYPGSNLAATYESFVRVDDPERGSSEHHVSMNHPLHYRGYIFFQASFVEGEPMLSIFSVARAPGLPLVYTGVALIGAGVAWMFYLKPYLARRQAALALEARRLQENQDHEADPPHSAAAAAAEPASGRA